MIETNCLVANWVFCFLRLLAAAILATMLKVHAGGGNTGGNEDSRYRANGDSGGNNNLSTFDLGADS
eukprot:15333262-Ditylum_brightwellii.AAC.1